MNEPRSQAFRDIPYGGTEKNLEQLAAELLHEPSENNLFIYFDIL